jgi:HEAT repeat protein
MPSKWILASLLSCSMSSMAAIPPQSVNALSEAYDVLSLPEGNQQQVAKHKGELLYPALIRISRSDAETMQTRWKALSLASSLKPEQVLPELELSLQSPEWFMRNAALLSLEKYHPAKAKTAAQRLLKDKALVVRSAAVQVLAKQMDAKIRDLFWEELNSPQNFRRKQSLWVRAEMISSLAEKPEAHETGMFVRNLKDSDKRIQASSVRAMEKLTKSTLGTAKMATAEKSELWIKWAKARPSGTL